MSNLVTLKPPAFNGKAGEDMVIWEMKFKVYVQEKGYTGILLSTIKRELLSSETVVMNLSDPLEKKRSDAKEMNVKVIHGLIHSFSQAKDMKKILAEQHRDKANCPT